MRMTAAVNSFSDGFSESDDIFNRKKLHDTIIRVATNAPDASLVLALNDKWGNGKTSFVKMMSSEIKKTTRNSLTLFILMLSKAITNQIHLLP